MIIVTQVQVIPWALEDSNYVKSSSQKLDPHKTVFVGGLHGMLTASSLAKIMDDLFCGVVYAGKNCTKEAILNSYRWMATHR